MKENVWIYDGLLECDVVLTDPANKRNCIIELHGPAHFLHGNLNMLNVNSEFTGRIKKMYGLVVMVPYQEWYELASVEEKKEYIGYKLSGFVGKMTKGA